MGLHQIIAKLNPPEAVIRLLTDYPEGLTKGHIKTELKISSHKTNNALKNLLENNRIIVRTVYNFKVYTLVKYGFRQ